MSQALPPKMAQQFAERAKNGEGKKLGDMVLFYQGNTEICLMCIDPPFGHITKISKAEVDAMKG